MITHMVLIESPVITAVFKHNIVTREQDSRTELLNPPPSGKHLQQISLYHV